MLIFPLLYISAFFASMKDIFRDKPGSGLLFMIFGLSIYNTSFSILYDTGFANYIKYLQPFKEVVIIAMLGYVVLALKERIRLHMIDYCVGAYLLYTLLYVALPIGEYSFMERLLAFKSTSFFGLIYLAGRLMDPRVVEIKKYFHFILIVAIAAAAVVSFEYITKFAWLEPVILHGIQSGNNR